MRKPLTIVIGGYIVGYPLGGMTWHHLHYLLGLHDLGHEVFFLEDSGEYSVPYNPIKQRCEVDSSYGRAYLEKTFRHFDLSARWCYCSSVEKRYYGMPKQELNDVLRRADLLMCVSGVTQIRPHRPRRVVAIDTDPGFTQIKMDQSSLLREYYQQFDAVATFGRLIGTDASSVPTHGMQWIPTSQPIALRHWPVEPVHSRKFSTIGKWEHSNERHVEFQGRQYLSSKSVEWTKMMNLPARCDWPLELAVQSMPVAVKEAFRRNGWRVSDAEQISADCCSFKQFIQDSAGEFTVAKQIYTSIPTGWFSDRSACYLASGRPVVTQSTGFERWLPTGEGLFSFRDLDTAADAIARVESDHSRHSRAARRIAKKHFDSRQVLIELLDMVM